MYIRYLAMVAAVGLVLSGSAALAQCGCGVVQPGYVAPVPAYTAYYAPTVAYYPPAPYVAYYPPPAPYVAYYPPAVAYPQPVVLPYRAYYGMPGWSMFGAPRLYVPGEPVRNVLRAVTP
jgi:hypothetical protein